MNFLEALAISMSCFAILFWLAICFRFEVKLL